MTAPTNAVKFYNPADNDYDMTKDPRCCWGWGPPDRLGCTHDMFGHACFREVVHKGRCWDGGDKPTADDPPCHTSQRPKDWDTVGRLADV